VPGIDQAIVKTEGDGVPGTHRPPAVRLGVAAIVGLHSGMIRAQDTVTDLRSVLTLPLAWGHE